VHALFTYTTIPGCRFAARAGVPYVLRPLGTLGGWSLAQRAWKKRPYYAMIERPHLARAAAIHVTAESEAAEVSALGFGEKARIIPLGVELGTSRRREGSAASLRMLFLSRIHPKKGLELVFAAMRILRDRGCGAIELEIAGDGDAEYLRSLHTEAARLGIESNIRFVGALHGDAKRDAFARADVFVLTSHNENFGIAAAEALAAGVPVILSGEVGLARDVAASGAGLVVPLEPPAIAAAIERLHTVPALRAAMAERAYTYASDHLSWAECGRRLFSLYQELIAAKRDASSGR
jgi:glycosyltransferase involved in cell wall biosynthesis